jgi:hypothetical protein
MRFIVSILLCLIITEVPANVPIEDSIQSVQAKWRRFAPHYIPIQFAGNIGFIASGVGYASRRDRYQISFLYGYAPESLAGVKIHTLTAKTIFHLYRFSVDKQHTLLPYAGLGLSLDVAGRPFFFQPPDMPRGYYDFPKSVHLIPSAGIKLRKLKNDQKIIRGLEIFTEVTTVDAYVYYLFLSEEVRMNRLLSLAIGVNLLIK